MRLTKFVKSDGENWIVVRIRCSAHVSYSKLDAVMRANGWIHWAGLRERMNVLKKKIAKSRSVQFPNWKEVKIQMVAGKRSDLPAAVANESTIHLVGEDGMSAEVEPLLEDIPFTDADAKALVDGKRPDVIVFDEEVEKQINESAWSCPTCKSKGFQPSILGDDRCTFCDGTEGGNPPEPPKQNSLASFAKSLGVKNG